MKRVRASSNSGVNDFELEPRPIELMLDSGAFGAWTRDDPIDVKDYIDFVKEYGHLFHTVVSLDAIPGKFGEKRTPKDTRIAIEKSRENHLAMKEAGLSPIPIFHQDEPLETLETLVDDGESYIGISPSGDKISTNDRWFGDVFRRITTSDGYPVVKTHGFGVTGPAVLRKYPWYSADSVTWVIKSGYGCIFVPRLVNGKFDYMARPISVWVTGAARKGVRFEFEFTASYKISDSQKDVLSEAITRFFIEEVGVTIGEMRYNPYVRMKALAVYYKKASEHLRYSRYVRDGSFFGYASDKPPMRWKHKKLIFAVGPPSNIQRSLILNGLGVKHRLLSYFDLREARPEEIVAYAKYGTVRTSIRPRRSSDWRRVEFQNRKRIYVTKHVLKEDPEGDRNGSQQAS